MLDRFIVLIFFFFFLKVEVLLLLDLLPFLIAQMEKVNDVNDDVDCDELPSKDGD